MTGPGRGRSSGAPGGDVPGRGGPRPWHLAVAGRLLARRPTPHETCAPVVSDSGSQRSHHGGGRRRQLRPGRHEQRRYTLRFIHRSEFVLARTIGWVPDPADDYRPPIPLAVIHGQPMPRGHRDVLPGRWEHATDLPRPRISRLGRPLAVIDGNEDGDLIKQVARPVNNIKMTRREGIEGSRINRSGRSGTAIKCTRHRARVRQR